MKHFFIFLVVILFSCNNKTKELTKQVDKEMISVDNYTTEINAWKKERITKLKDPYGWLSLVGLHWLDEGINTVGGATSDSIQLPRVTETLGAYMLTSNPAGDKIFFGKVEGPELISNGEEYLGGDVPMTYPPVVVKHKSLAWYVLPRGDKYALRLKDSLSENRVNFGSIPYFDLDKKYKIPAKVVAATEIDSIEITNVIGHLAKYPIEAYLQFYVAERLYRLAALEQDDSTFFLIFDDESSGATTYGGGRFLYPSKPCDTCEQVTLLDFNKAQNPPCSFTNFATCPLPPRQNHIHFEVNAGEMNMGH